MKECYHARLTLEPKLSIQQLNEYNVHAKTQNANCCTKELPLQSPPSLKATVRSLKTVAASSSEAYGDSKTLHELMHAELHRSAICERAKLTKRKSSSARLLWGISAPSKELEQASACCHHLEAEDLDDVARRSFSLCFRSLRFSCSISAVAMSWSVRSSPVAANSL